MSILLRGSRQTLPMIHQAAQAECGLACMAMIANYHGLEIDLSSIRSRYAPSLRGMNLLT